MAVVLTLARFCKTAVPALGSGEAKLDGVCFRKGNFPQIAAFAAVALLC